MIKKVIGATGIGPMHNILKTRSTQKAIDSSSGKLTKMVEELTSGNKQLNKLQDEVTSRGSFWNRNLTHFLPGNKKKLGEAETRLQDLINLQNSRSAGVQALRQSVDKQKKSVAELLAERPAEFARMQTLYGTAGLGAGGYYGGKHLLGGQEE